MRSLEAIRDKVDEVEAICSLEVGRNIGPLVASARGGLNRALTLIAAHGAPKSIGIASGCFIPWGSPPAAETDGPVGAVLLARALQQLGHHACLVTDDLCVGAIIAARDAIDDWESVCPVCVATDDGSLRVTDGVLLEASISSVVSVERLGPNDRGEIMSIGAEDRAEVSGWVHRFFQREGQETIGIGDGGNELGMGNLSREVVASSIKHGALIHCTVPASALIVSGCSNWGALGMVASLYLAYPEEVSADLLSDELHNQILCRLVVDGPAVDGVTGRNEATVDGLPGGATFEILAALRSLLRVSSRRAED